jgi:hypothetical protein
MAMTHHRDATRNVSGSTQGNATADKVNSPSAEAPAEAAEGAQADCHAEADSDSHHYTDRDRRHHKTGVGDKQSAPQGPRVIDWNGNQKGVDRRNHDRTLLNDDPLLWGRHQHFRRLRLETQGLDGVHDVFRLVVIGVAQLRLPARVLREILEHGGKLTEAFNSRVPSHVVHGGRALIHGHRNVGDRPRLRRGNLVRISGRRQYLSDQRVRIEGDRGYQLIQLVRVQRDIGSRRRLLRVDSRKLRCGNQQRREHDRQHLAHGFA